MSAAVLRGSTYHVILAGVAEHEVGAMVAFHVVVAAVAMHVIAAGILVEHGFDPKTIDRGWTVEIAIPWGVLAEAAGRPAPPDPGDRWRINFSRVQWTSTVEEGRYVKLTDPDTGEFTRHKMDEGFYPHTIRTDDQDRVWFTLALSSQVAMFDRETEEFTVGQARSAAR